MKTILKRLFPSPVWQALRHVRHSPGLFWDAFDYFKMYGLQETWQKIKVSNRGWQNQLEQSNLSPAIKLTDYVASEPVTLSETELNVAVVVHVFYLDLLPEILRHLLFIPYRYSLYFTVSEENKPSLLELLQPIKIDYEVVVCHSSGYDLTPFLDRLPDLQAKNIDLVCKIHTKKGKANLENRIGGIENIWFDMLIDPLLGSAQTVQKIVQTFESNPDVGMIGPAALYKSAQALMYGNDVAAARLLNVLDDGCDPAQEWGFFAGSMFWARMSIFQPVVEKRPLLDEQLQDDQTMKTGTLCSVFHAMERVLGILPGMTGMRTALSFSIATDKTSHAIYVPADELQYCSPIGVGMTLQNEHYLSKSLEKINKRPGFDVAYYLQNTPVCAKLKMDPRLHFLRYGVYLNQPPNREFSPFAYWAEKTDVLRKRFNPFVHYLSNSAFARENALLPPESNTDEAVKHLKNSPLFNAGYYLKENPDVAASGMNPLKHYCKYGWKEGRRPSRGFDAHWYQNEYLQHANAPVNPLLHYLLLGQAKGFGTEPRYPDDLALQETALPSQPQRACLFAAYDPDGRIDDAVISFVRELSRHADVYFLSDGLLQKSELEKLSSYVVGAWGIRHGEYDFGSYKRLARYLVGWEQLSSYDEVLLVNDSSYLLRPLDDVFKKMDAKACSWWGLQATKGMTHTRDRKSNQFLEKIPMSTVKQELLKSYVEEPDCDFHVGSYFLAFRKPVIESGDLQLLLDSVKKERRKKDIILNNEVGLTRRLICRGYDFDTFMDDLYPFHPVYSNQVFEMIKAGFPLFKRFFLSENHYHVSDLWRWRERLLEILPGLDLKPIEDNLHRVVDAGKLFTNLHRQETPQKLMSRGEFIRADKKTPKDLNCWAFPVCAYDHMLTGNDRAVFEEVKNDPKIKKVILSRSKQVVLEGENVHVVPLESLAGQRYLLEAGVVFIKHSVRKNVAYPLDPKRHKFINLWHGIPLKRIGTASNDLQEEFKWVVKEHKKLHCVIASSSIDRMAMTAGFYPLVYQDIWVTGLPRNDFVLREEALMPEDFQQQAQTLAADVNDRRLVLFAPTFRKDSKGYYKFTAAEIRRIHACLEEHNLVMGVREHMAAGSHSYYEVLRGPRVFNAGMKNYPNIEVLYRKADLLITDYSSCFIDFMLAGKGMISFAYDYKKYSEVERGLFYDLEFVFPGPICHDFEALIKGLNSAVASLDDEPTESYRFKRKIFFDYIDDKSSARLVRRILDERGSRQEIL